LTVSSQPQNDVVIEEAEWDAEGNEDELSIDDDDDDDDDDNEDEDDDEEEEEERVVRDE